MEAAEVNQTAMEVLGQFRVIFGSVRQYFREVEARCGVSGSQVWLMTEVRRTPGIGVSELSKRLSIHQSTGSILVEKLVLRGFLSKTRSRHDQRRIGLCLTEQGETALARLQGPAEGNLHQALATIPEVVLQTLRVNLNELIQHIEQGDARFAQTPLSEIVTGDREDGRAIP